MKDILRVLFLLLLAAVIPKPPVPEIPTDASERVVYYAMLFDGHKETDHNRSFYIDHWLTRLGVPVGNNYCAAFTAFILDTAQVSYPTVRSAVARHYQTSNSVPVSRVLNGQYQVPPGAILVWGRTGSWTGHTDFTTEYWEGASGMAIGANVTPPGQESGGRGNGVYHKRRTIVPHAYFGIRYITETS